MGTKKGKPINAELGWFMSSVMWSDWAYIRGS